MNSYDPAKIGREIADGGDRKVYIYDTDKVIKISSLAFIAGKKLHKKYMHDYRICKEYLGAYVLETIGITDVRTGKYVEIQPFINGEKLSQKHLKNPTTKFQLNDILQIIHRMKDHGIPRVDLVGNIGMIKPCLSNMLVTSTGDIQIIDAMLLEGKTVRPAGIILELCMPLIIARQNYLIRKFLA